MKKKLEFLYIDIMRDYVWAIWHRILHKGRWNMREYLFCNHHNPWYILTPRLLKRQFGEALKGE